MTDVQALIDRSPFSAFQLRVFALCFLIVLFDGFDAAAIGYIAPSLAAEWGVSKPQLGPVLSAALFGLAAGALASGPFADRFGRRLTLILAVFVFSLACLASAFSDDLRDLTIWRFVTGVGIGAAMPNAVTLTSEYSPARARALVTNAMFCGFPLGAALGGLLAAWVIPAFGWRSVLIAGGVAPLALGVVLLFALPDSIRHMTARGVDAARLRAILSRIAPEAAQAQAFTLGEAVEPGRGVAAQVLSRGRRVGTLMLWVAYFMGLVIFYAMINWLPLLLKEAQIDARTATLITSLFALGGVGAVASGWLMDRANGNWTLAACYAAAALGVAAIGPALGAPGALVAVVFFAGVAMNTAQASMPSLAAAFYPTPARATGVAWMLGVGRFGGVAGSFLVGWLTQLQLTLPQIFLVVAAAGMVAAGALAIKQFAHPGR